MLSTSVARWEPSTANISTFLDAIPNLLWSVVEQPHFVRCGRLEFETERLRFFESIADACQRGANPIWQFFLAASNTSQARMNKCKRSLI